MIRTCLNCPRPRALHGGGTYPAPKSGARRDPDSPGPQQATSWPRVHLPQESSPPRLPQIQGGLGGDLYTSLSSPALSPHFRPSPGEWDFPPRSLKRGLALTPSGSQILTVSPPLSFTVATGRKRHYEDGHKEACTPSPPHSLALPQVPQAQATWNLTSAKMA